MKLGGLSGPMSHAALRRSPSRSPVPIQSLAILVSVLALVIAASPASTPRDTPASQGASGAAIVAAAACATPGRAARDVSLAEPKYALAKGDSVTTVYEFSVVNTTLPSIHVRVNAPSFFANFVLANGSKLSVYTPPRAFNISNSSWTAASAATTKKVLTQAETFSATTAVTMTTELVGVMATAADGTVELAFRWQWTITYASNGSSISSPWSPLRSTGADPTIFYPAPYVELASTSNSTVAIGGTFTAYLLGSISGTEFNSELEYATTGNVVHHQATYTAVGNSTPDAVSVVIESTIGAFSPATMLDHVRNSCGSLLYSISVKAIYAPSATVQFLVQPASCGPITFNGTSYGNDTSTKLAPSTASFAISPGSCAGQSFVNWTFTDGLYLKSPTTGSNTVVVSSSATLTARFT
jgi:hypothetical protein